MTPLLSLLIALAGASLAVKLILRPRRVPHRHVKYIGASGRQERARVQLTVGILSSLLPATLVNAWYLVVGTGRGTAGDVLTSEEAVLTGIEGLRWRMLFAGYRDNDMAWLRRRQLKMAVAIALLLMTIASIMGVAAWIYAVLPFVGLGAGVLFVRLELGWRVESRRRRIRAESVHYFYGLAAFLAASLPLEDALRDLIDGENTELSYETRRLLLQVGAGMPLTRAFKIMAARCNTDEVTMAVNRIGVALTSGTTALAPSLRIIATQCRQTIAAGRVIRRKRAVQRNYAFLALTAVPALIIATAAPAIYQAFTIG